MPLKSKTTIKVSGIPPKTTVEKYGEFVRHVRSPLPKKSGIFHSKRPVVPYVPIPATTLEPETETSFASQNGVLEGTISFTSETLKKKAFQWHEDSDFQSKWPGWRLHDSFDYLTILHDSADKADME
jgi:hypothetical protein